MTLEAIVEFSSIVVLIVRFDTAVRHYINDIVGHLHPFKPVHCCPRRHVLNPPTPAAPLLVHDGFFAGRWIIPTRAIVDVLVDGHSHQQQAPAQAHPGGLTFPGGHPIPVLQLLLLFIISEKYLHFTERLRSRGHQGDILFNGGAPGQVDGLSELNWAELLSLLMASSLCHTCHTRFWFWTENNVNKTFDGSKV